MWYLTAKIRVRNTKKQLPIGTIVYVDLPILGERVTTYNTYRKCKIVIPSKYLWNWCAKELEIDLKDVWTEETAKQAAEAMNKRGQKE